MLSKAGKEILLKTVVQAIPMYVMSVFLLPISLCTELERMMNSFWWGQNGSSSRGIKWMSWDRICGHKMEGGLGFRKLHEFNLAMLGKQGWKLLSHPDSLVARIFKARYYPNTSFLEAKAGANPSFVWKSILASQSLVKSGARRLIGDGSTVKVWEEPWLPDDSNPYIESPVCCGLENAYVNSLRRTGISLWDEDILSDLFNERDKSLIMQIPVSNGIKPDGWYWFGDRKGEYNVKNGYRRLLSSRNVISLGGTVGLWKAIWGLEVPNKVKNFIWRANVNCLPTKLALKRKQIDISEICPICNDNVEDVIHILIKCPFARRAWNLSRIGDRSGDVVTIEDWWMQIIQGQDKMNTNLAAMVSWSLWNNRNDVVWKGRSRQLAELIKHAEELLREWHHAKEGQSRQIQRRTTANEATWLRPEIGWLKCNIDAAIFQHGGFMGYGWVLRDDEGTMIAAKNGVMNGLVNPAMAEAMSCREALSWLKSLNIDKVIVESDALQVINSLNGEHGDKSYFGSIINDCKILSKDFGVCLFQFVKRSANQVAHMLAKATGSMSDRGTWFYNHPQFFSNVIEFDLH